MRFWTWNTAMLTVWYVVGGGVLLILANPSYHQVTIECPTVGVSQTFMCNKWLAQDEGDGAIERELSGK